MREASSSCKGTYAAGSFGGASIHTCKSLTGDLPYQKLQFVHGSPVGSFSMSTHLYKYMLAWVIRWIICYIPRKDPMLPQNSVKHQDSILILLSLLLVCSACIHRDSSGFTQSEAWVRHSCFYHWLSRVATQERDLSFWRLSAIFPILLLYRGLLSHNHRSRPLQNQVYKNPSPSSKMSFYEEYQNSSWYSKISYLDTCPEFTCHEWALSASVYSTWWSYLCFYQQGYDTWPPLCSGLSHKSCWCIFVHTSVPLHSPSWLPSTLDSCSHLTCVGSAMLSTRRSSLLITHDHTIK